MKNFQESRSQFNAYSSQKSRVFKSKPDQTPDTKPELKAPVIFGRNTSNEAARTPWPRFGRIRYEDLLKTPVFEDIPDVTYENGLDVLIYMAGCSGLQNKAQAYKLPLFKIGATQIPDLQVRQRDLNADAYGSAAMQDGKPVFEAKWTNWEMRQAELLSDCAPNSPVQLVARGLSVRLPQGLSPVFFEKEIHRRLYPCALHIFAKSKNGQKHFGLLDIDPL